MKQPNVRPGDKALVVKSASPENLMALVLVVEEYAAGTILPGFDVPFVTDESEPVWIVESLGRDLVTPVMRASQSSDGQSLGYRVTTEGVLRTRARVFQDSCLRRLPDDEDEDTGITDGVSAPKQDSVVVVEAL